MFLILFPKILVKLLISFGSCITHSFSCCISILLILRQIFGAIAFGYEHEAIPFVSCFFLNAFYRHQDTLPLGSKPVDSPKDCFSILASFLRHLIFQRHMILILLQIMMFTTSKNSTVEVSIFLIPNLIKQSSMACLLTFIQKNPFQIKL